DRAVPGSAEQLGERTPRALATEQGGCGRVLEDAGLDLGEDALGCERAKVPVECVRVGSDCGCDVGNGARPGFQLVGDPQLRDDRSGAGSDGAMYERPENRLRCELAHPRARMTAAAASPRSVSESVRQSSRVRPSRTTATTGGSP